MAEPSQQASSSGTSKMKAAEQGTGYTPAPGAQGLIDRMLVDGLRRGYEDFIVSVTPCFERASMG